MSIITTRRISQIFFFILFLWFCVVSTLGDQWWQLRGWPVNWIIQLDPLVGLATLLSTRTLYAGLLWGLATVVLTIIFGRFFCSWVCPFGTIHQFVGYAANRKKSVAAKIKLNRYRPAQSIKYWILTFLLAISGFELVVDLVRLPATHGLLFGILLLALLVLTVIYTAWQNRANLKMAGLSFFAFSVLWLLTGYVLNGNQVSVAPLQIGLLDPIPLVYRSINLIVLPLIDLTALKLTAVPRLYDGTVADCSGIYGGCIIKFDDTPLLLPFYLPGRGTFWGVRPLFSVANRKNRQ